MYELELERNTNVLKLVGEGLNKITKSQEDKEPVWALVQNGL